jgi:16S rRNA (cytidine1402-2'-O)-methyltransferase
MEGFLPRKAGERALRYEEWASEERTIVFYESPQRVASVRGGVSRAPSPTRRVAVARELTKLHEEVLRGTLLEVPRISRSASSRGESSSSSKARRELLPVGDDVIVAALEEQWSDGATTARRR